MSGKFYLMEGDVAELQELMKDVGGPRAREIVQDYLSGVGADTIESMIRARLPQSGRRWRGKKTAAAKARPFSRATGQMSVTIRSKSAYNYLYFPDDGSNTHHHYGGQHFMHGGAEDARPSIMEAILAQLTDAIFE